MAKSREQYVNEKMDNEAVSFNLVDQHTVERLKRDGVIEVPTKKLDVPKDMQWNEKYIASQMLKGIENGDSVDKMASSIFLEIFSREDTFNLTEKGVSDLIKRCHNSAIRNARTMTTSAENHGRLDSYKDLAAKGVVQKKEWMSTPDDRTRPSHVDIDGEEQDIDKVFSNGCMFPGDGKGPAEEVWMCRCTMTDHIIGFRRADGSISKVNYTPDKTLHEEQMEAEKERRGIESKPQEVNDQEIKENNIPEIHFVPAETIEEAERFANENFVRGGMNLTGKNISYKGIDIDVANHINERLNEIYSQYNIDQLSSLEAFGKNNKKIYSSNSDAPFFTTNFGNIGMNTTIIKSESAIEKYIADGENSFAYIMDNINILSGSQLELAKVYETAGRNLVDNSLEGMITHEIGHHISYMTNINRELSQLQTSDWKEYAKNLSGYSNHSFGEYVAESWTAYYNGDTEKVQPELIKIFEGLKK